MVATPQLRAFLDALDEPALLLAGQRVLIANPAANLLLGRAVEGSDIRLAIRHPHALHHILTVRMGDVEITGIDAINRPWLLSVRAVGNGHLLVRMTDRSATRAAEQMRVDFVANASHELRTPLTTILGYSETLAEEDSGLDQATVSRFGNILRAESRRMLRIIEDLMSLSRIEADRFVTPQDGVEVEELARIAAANAKAQCEARQCTVELDVEEDLPPVPGDYPQLLQLLDNLVSNAVRYGCRSDSCEVRISARSTTDTVVLSVSDNGEGIAAEHLPRLTERFYRVDEARSRVSGGTGLGLAIVKHIVERHRGTLEIRSAPGAGTKVIVILPRRGPAR